MENVILTSSLGLGVIVYSLIARWYIIPALDKHPRNATLQPLILLHCFRYFGLSFLLPGVVSADIAAAFAVPTAYGDLTTSLLALMAVIALRNQWGVALPLVWLFNVVGTVDLLNALPQGLLNIHAGQLGGAYIIPALIVPALLVSHFLVFRLLIKRAQA